MTTPIGYYERRPAQSVHTLSELDAAERGLDRSNNNESCNICHLLPLPESLAVIDSFVASLFCDGFTTYPEVNINETRDCISGYLFFMYSLPLILMMKFQVLVCGARAQLMRAGLPVAQEMLASSGTFFLVISVREGRRRR